MKEILLSIQPLLNICKFFGFFPPNILNVKDRKSTAVYMIIIVLFIIIYVFVSYARMVIQFGQASKGSNLSKIAYHLSIFLMFAMMFLLMIGNFLKREKFVKILLIFKKIDTKVSEIVKLRFTR